MNAAPTNAEATAQAPWYRRPAVVIAALVVLLLVIGGGVWAVKGGSGSGQPGKGEHPAAAEGSTQAAAPAPSPATDAAPSAEPAPAHEHAHAARPPAASGGARKLDATTYATEYRSDQAKADGMYKGKTLEVTGTVESTVRSAENTIMLVLHAAKERYVHARMERSESNAAARLARGERVAVVCRGDGVLMQIPQLADCRFK